ncbi:MAG: ABC transporter ATP-binding protein [Thomasclavelia sp.]|jgi:putative ABC transport system ATP-binding protein|nr:ABC transporter ATP-binding protein [Thomasclavelia sp.]
MKTILDVQQVEKYYGKKGALTKALDNLSFSVQEGEFVAMMGASGSGKTTLLNCVSSIDSVTKGRILVNNLDITTLRGKKLTKYRSEELGFVFQDFNLLDTLTNFENIALALTIQRVKPKLIDDRVNKIAKDLDILDILSKYPYECSGGQKQRVACARALVTNPTLVLADEPTGALDSKNARMLMESLEDLNQKLKATILMVTHDPFSASYANRIIFLKDGKIFNEINRGTKTNKQLLDEILSVQSLLGGDLDEHI